MKKQLHTFGERLFLTNHQRNTNWNENISTITSSKSFTNKTINVSKWNWHSNRVDIIVNWWATLEWNGTMYFSRTSIVNKAYKGLCDLAPNYLLISHHFLSLSPLTEWYSFSSSVPSFPQWTLACPRPLSPPPPLPSLNTGYALFALLSQALTTCALAISLNISPSLTNLPTSPHT